MPSNLTEAYASAHPAPSVFALHQASSLSPYTIRKAPGTSAFDHPKSAQGSQSVQICK
jgi:hypothetical protein